MKHRKNAMGESHKKQAKGYVKMGKLHKRRIILPQGSTSVHDIYSANISAAGTYATLQPQAKSFSA